MMRIAIAEDNSFLARSLVDRLKEKEMIVKQVASDGKKLLEGLKENRNVDLILMDIQMPNMNGIEAVASVKRLYPQIKVVMLTVMDDEESIFKSIRAGADGYLLKDIDSDKLFSGLQEIMEGGAPMSPSIARKALKLLRTPLQLHETTNENIELSKRETEVLEQLSHGLNYIEIAENLIISQGTVRKHLENIYRKLQVHNKIEAIDKAKKARLI